jgi:hypothetical protein
MATTKRKAKQNLTIRLGRKTIQSARILAARRSMSLGALLACQIERLAGEGQSYESAPRQALKLLDHGYDLGGKTPSDRDERHEQ